MKGKLGQYKKTSITTSSPGRLLLMLYGAAIKNVVKAKEAIEKKSIPEKCRYILNAQDIVMELANALDHKNGGELSERLEGLYDYMSFQLTEAHVNNEVEPLNNVEKVLRALNEGWVEAVKQVEGKRSE